MGLLTFLSYFMFCFCTIEEAQHWTGTWQEYINVKEDALVAVPDELTMEQAASFWINPVRLSQQSVLHRQQ